MQSQPPRALRELPQNFIPLAIEPRAVLDTATAAAHFNLKTETLMRWGRVGGPIQPVRIGRRFAWRTSDLRDLLEGDAS